MTAYHIWDAMEASKPLSEQAGGRMKPADFFIPVLFVLGSLTPQYFLSASLGYEMHL